MDVLNLLERAAAAEKQRAIDPLARAASTTGRFLGDLSHRSNIDWQSEYLAKDLREHGVANSVAQPFARQQAFEQDISNSPERLAALPALLALLRAQTFHHR